jgi:hypothetical protein
MKAKIVSQVVYGSTMDFVHGGGEEIKRLVVEKNGETYEAITPYEGHVFVLSKFRFSKDVKIVGEVEVPDELVQQAIQSDELQRKLFAQLNKILKDK